MAINNWRYIVTWGFMEPDGTIVEERQYVNWPVAYSSKGYNGADIDALLANSNLNSTPLVTSEQNYNYDSSNIDSLLSNSNLSTTFSPAESFRLSANGYYDQGNTAMWDAYSALRKWSDAFSTAAKQMNDFFNVYGDDVAKREMALAWIKESLANKLYNDMSQQKDYVMWMFWPNGTLTKEINAYYDDLWNYLATDAGRQAATIAAQWVHSWASLWAIRAQQNQAYNETFARYVQAKEQEINAKQTVASNLINFMSTLRQEYWDTTNAYIISQYQRANDLLNAVSQSIAQSNIELGNARLSNSLKWSGWSGGTFNPDHKMFMSFESEMLNNEAAREAWNQMTNTQKQSVYSNWLYQKAWRVTNDTEDLTNWWEETKWEDDSTQTSFKSN